MVDVNNVKNGKEASEVTEGKSSRMRWGSKTKEKEIIDALLHLGI